MAPAFRIASIWRWIHQRASCAPCFLAIVAGQSVKVSSTEEADIRRKACSGVHRLLTPDLLLTPIAGPDCDRKKEEIRQQKQSSIGLRGDPKGGQEPGHGDPACDRSPLHEGSLAGHPVAFLMLK